jgi:hypothetical protein
MDSRTMNIANSEKILVSFIDNINRSSGNPMSNYFVLLKGQMADFFRALDSLITFEKSSNVIASIQNRIFASVFSNSQMSFMNMLFADTMTINTQIEFAELPRTIRSSFESQISHGKRNAAVSIKEAFLLKTLWLIRKHNGNFAWKNFVFAITDSIFDFLTVCWPTQAAKFLVLFEYFFTYELEIISTPFAKITHGVWNEYEILQINEPILVLYNVYIEKYIGYLRSEMAKSVSKRDPHIYAIFKMWAQKSDSFFSNLFRVIHSKQKFVFKSVKLVVHQYFAPLNYWNIIDEFVRLYAEINYPIIKKVQEEFIKFMLNADYDDSQDLADIEVTIKFFLQIRKYEKDKGLVRFDSPPIIDSETLLRIYKKLVSVAYGADILRSIVDVALIIGLSNVHTLQSEIEQEVANHNQKIRDRKYKPDGISKHSSKNLNWNSPFDNYAESKLLFWVFYFIAMAIDCVFMRKQTQGIPKKSENYLIRNGEVIPYKNPMMVGRLVPVTNLRSFARKSVRNFLIGGLISFWVFVLY